jgi:phosphoribosylamine--glycine ligase
MADAGHPFAGFLYVGLALTRDEPKVLEFNVRLGDPEAQAILPRMKTDLVDVLEGAGPEWSDDVTVNVVLATQGYPEAPGKGAVIEGLDRIPDDVHVFHAGTKREGRKLVVDGGRVLSLVGVGPDLSTARGRAYAAAEMVRWPGMHYRTDIGA